MKNKEKYAMKIVEIACDGKSVAVDKRTGKFDSCDCIICSNCLFDGKHGCNSRRREWAESDYIEKHVISKRDRASLDFLIGKYKYIARDKTGYLYVYSAKPDKCDVFWSRNNCDCFCLNNCVDVNLPMVKWSDKEPWLIDDLKKLEVVEEYN